MKFQNTLKLIFVLLTMLSFEVIAETSSDTLKKRIEEIRSDLKDHADEVESCVSKNGMQARPQEKILLMVQINEHGDVMAADINYRKSTIVDGEVTKCLVAAAKKWHLSAAPSGEIYRVSYMYVIKKAQSKDRSGRDRQKQKK